MGCPWDDSFTEQLGDDIFIDQQQSAICFLTWGQELGYYCPELFRENAMNAILSVLVFLAVSWGVEVSAQAPTDGEHLFIQKGCLGCHGVGAHGGAGPDLANP